jgi:hypothetical protein
MPVDAGVPWLKTGSGLNDMIKILSESQLLARLPEHLCPETRTNAGV